MDPKDFLLTAHDLIASHRREADLRSAVSRSYYAVYLLIACAVKSDIPLALRQQRSLGDKERVPHDRLAKILKECGHDRLEGIGTLLSNLKAGRVESDYHPDKVVDLRRAKKHLATAQRVCERIETIGLTTLTAVLRIYLAGSV